MEHLKDRLDNTNLNELCGYLTQEITQLATSDYKLKLVFVLVHIIEVSQKELSSINTNNLVNDLSELITKTCDDINNLNNINNIFKTKFESYRSVLNVYDNIELQNLANDIRCKLQQLDKIVKQLVKERNKMMPEEVNQSKQKKM